MLTIELEGNKLIAEFHGWQHIHTPKDKGKGYWSFSALGKAQWDANSFEYHSSWDWLMPVGEWCENNEGCTYTTESLKSKFESEWNAKQKLKQNP